MRKSVLSLLSVAAILLTACSHTSVCPEYPAMSDAAKAELSKKCLNAKGDFLPSCENLEEWLGRVEKLKRQLGTSWTRV